MLRISIAIGFVFLLLTGCWCPCEVHGTTAPLQCNEAAGKPQREPGAASQPTRETGPASQPSR